MRSIPFTMTETDFKRIVLATRYAECGLISPTQEAEGKGFKFNIRHSGITMSFRGQRVAQLDGRRRSHYPIEISDHLPAEYDAAVTRIFTKIKDTAKAVDSQIRADAREVKQRFNEAQTQLTEFPFDARRLGPIIAAAEAVGSRVRIRVYHDDERGTEYTFGMMAQNFAENNISHPTSFAARGGQLVKITSLPDPERLEDLAHQCGAHYADVLKQATDLYAAGPRADGLSAHTLEHWAEMKGNVWQEKDGLRVSGDHYRVIVKLQNVLLMKVVRETHWNEDDTRVQRCAVEVYGDMPDALRGALMHKIEEGILAVPSDYDPATAAPPAQIVGVEAAQALADMPAGGYDL